jgi:uncharacterized protein YuzE
MEGLMSIKVEVDQSVGAAYIELSSNAVDRTEKLGGGILVDLDAMNVVVGIEVLSLDAELPLARLRDEFHVHSSVVDLLERLRPTIGYQVSRFQQATEGTSAGVGQRIGAAA